VRLEGFGSIENSSDRMESYILLLYGSTLLCRVDPTFLFHFYRQWATSIDVHLLLLFVL
jgi:hypothetical protein